jgi:hypothetical protein
MKSSLGKLWGTCRNGALESSCRDCAYNAIRKQADGVKGRAGTSNSHNLRAGVVAEQCLAVVPRGSFPAVGRSPAACLLSFK